MIPAAGPGEMGIKNLFGVHTFPEEVYRQDVIRWPTFQPDFFLFLLFPDHGAGFPDHVPEIGKVGAQHDF